MEDGKSLADLAGGLSFFQIDNESQAGPGSQRQVLLRNAKMPAGLSDRFTNLLGSVFHDAKFPLGNNRIFTPQNKLIIPERE